MEVDLKLSLRYNNNLLTICVYGVMLAQPTTVGKWRFDSDLHAPILKILNFFYINKLKNICAKKQKGC